jgi:hypothetical protein
MLTRHFMLLSFFVMMTFGACVQPSDNGPNDIAARAASYTAEQSGRDTDSVEDEAVLNAIFCNPDLPGNKFCATTIGDPTCWCKSIGGHVGVCSCK